VLNLLPGKVWELLATGDVSVKERLRLRLRERNLMGKVGGTFRALISIAAPAESKKGRLLWELQRD
jgi:hypothetical protein